MSNYVHGNLLGSVLLYALKVLLVCFTVFMRVRGVTACPVYDDRYAIHMFDGLQAFESFSSE